MAGIRIISKEELEDLCTCLHYDPVSGKFLWKITVNSRSVQGTEAGHLSQDGYVRIVLRKKPYMAHRLAWIMYYGLESQPTLLDHEDTVRHHNWISNIRKATSSQNVFNSRLQKRSSTGVKGVTFNKREQKYQARVGFAGRHGHIGYFRTLQEAANAVKAAREKYHGEFCNHGDRRKDE